MGWRTSLHTVIRIVPLLLILEDVFVPEGRAVHVIFKLGNIIAYRSRLT
jgi:hypothetical protein